MVVKVVYREWDLIDGEWKLKVRSLKGDIEDLEWGIKVIGKNGEWTIINKEYVIKVVGDGDGDRGSGGKGVKY